MPDVTLFGFPRSVYVQMAGIVLTHKEVPYAFHDLETEMNAPSHLALHPFEGVPILRHGDFTVYETAAITAYIDEAFDGPKLTPVHPQQRAHVNQWISAVNAYYYPYLIYHVSHERNVFPQLGIPSDEKVVEHALPKVEVCLQVMERDNGIEVTALHNHMLGDEPRLFFMHFWANDDATKLATGLKAALSHINIAKG